MKITTLVEVEGNHLILTSYDENQNEPRDGISGKVKKAKGKKGGHNAPEFNLELDEAVKQVESAHAT